MKNFVVNVSTKTSKIYLEETSVAVDGENIAGQVIFKFNDDEFIDGIARLEWQNGSDKYFQLMEKVGKTYVLPIKNVMTHEGKMYFQLVITQEQIGEEIPVFKSNQFYVYVEKSINAEGEPPSGYDTWLDYANAKLIEMDNLNITATKSGNTETITLTDKQGVEHKTYIYDGQNGQDGKDGKDGADGKDAKINGYNTLEIVAGDNITIDQVGNTLTINGEASGGGNVDDVTVNGSSVVENKIAKVIVPTKVGDLQNDSGFITNTVNNLTNYYLSSETYTKTEVNTLIGNIEKLTVQVVQELPTTGESNVLYLVPKTGSTGDVYNEYMYINNNWELIGTTEIDLSNYYTKSEVNILLNEKQDIVQYSTMPTASASNVGQIIQYVGTTSGLYVNGFLYKCVEYTSGSYRWEYINTDYSKKATSAVSTLYQNNDFKENVRRMLATNQQIDVFPVNTSGGDINGFNGIQIVTIYQNIKNHPTSIFVYSTILSYYSFNHYGLINWEQSNATVAWNNDEPTITNMSRASGYDTNNVILTTKNTSSFTPTANYHPATKKYVDDKAATKQDTLVSGTNIKTINNESILGSGNLTVGVNTFEGTISEWNQLTTAQKEAYLIAIVDNNVELSQTDINNINGIMATSGDIESDLTEEQAEDITDEIVGGE